MTVLPTLRQLTYLVAVVDERHFGRAAEKCHVTQSTLSAGIAELETLLQATLIERTRRKVLPTPLGEEIAAKARAVLRAAEDIAETARAGAEPLTGPFRLGVIPTVGPFVLPRVLGGLRAAYPDLKLFLREEQTRALIREVNRGTLEAALLALPYDIGDLAAMELGPDPFWLVCPKDHPLARTRRKTVRSEDVPPDELLLLEDGHCLREHALTACHLPRPPGGGAIEGTSLYTLVEMVANGLGVTFLPEIALSAGLLEGKDVAVRRLGPDSPARRIGLVWRRAFPREGDVAALGAYLKGRMAGLRAKRGG